jgi:hypothetical protein
LAQALGQAVIDTDLVTPAPRPTAGQFQLKDVKIHAPWVKRFVLASQVDNKEPRGELSKIAFNSAGSAVVWAYSEVIDRAASVLRYVWAHEGKQVAQVKVNVRGNRWRSYSTKVINRRMEGNWRVELQDNQGRLLARADFLLQ